MERLTKYKRLDVSNLKYGADYGHSAKMCLEYNRDEILDKLDDKISKDEKLRLIKKAGNDYNYLLVAYYSKVTVYKQAVRTIFHKLKCSGRDDFMKDMLEINKALKTYCQDVLDLSLFDDDFDTCKDAFLYGMYGDLYETREKLF